MYLFINCIGIFVFLGLAFLFSKSKEEIRWRSIGVLFGMNLFIAWFLTQFSIGRELVSIAAAGFVWLVDVAYTGIAFAFPDWVHGCNTLASIVTSPKYATPHMKQLGIFNIDGVDCGEKESAPLGAFGRLTELSRGKDTTIGHWEIAGIVSEKPLPTYPDGFPPEIIAKLEKAFGRKILCNKPYSGTQVIHGSGSGPSLPGRRHLAGCAGG